MKLFFEIALAVNVAATLFTAYVWLFHRRTYWPALRSVLEAIIKSW